MTQSTHAQRIARRARLQLRAELAILALGGIALLLGGL